MACVPTSLLSVNKRHDDPIIYSRLAIQCRQIRADGREDEFLALEVHEYACVLGSPYYRPHCTLIQYRDRLMSVKFKDVITVPFPVI